MEKYESPKVIPVEELAEGIYASSGSSIYMNGVYQEPTYNPMRDGYKKGRGCEGCPAWNGKSCRFTSKPEEMLNWDNDYRPTWEVEGHLPDEKGY